MAEPLVGKIFDQIASYLDERQRRLFGAAAANALGRGGLVLASRATGLSQPTLIKAQKELAEPASMVPGRARRPGGGRWAKEQHDPTLVKDLESLVEPTERGDPESPLRWTIKSTYTLADELNQTGHEVSQPLVHRTLRVLGYGFRGDIKTVDGRTHPDRNQQFLYINEHAKRFMERGQPVVSVDAKKRETVGNYKNAGRTWNKGDPPKVKMHDFPDPELGKVTPYGVYDPAQNQAWVSVGTDHDTAEFAVATLGRWWDMMGKATYPGARELLITADAGGSNGARLRLWKRELQEFADQSRLHVTVCHFPPGSSKWNKIEHRLFSQISLNWRGRPLTSHEVIVNLIAATRTKTGLRVQAALDKGSYPTKIKVPKKEFNELNLERHEWHGEWNYTIRPRKNLQKEES